MIGLSCRWLLCGVLVLSALDVKANDLPDDCPAYREEESKLLTVLGAEGGTLALSQQVETVAVNFEETTDATSLRFLFNEKDVTALFRLTKGKEGAAGLAVVKLPLELGSNTLRVSGYAKGDGADEEWEHCEPPPLRWQEWRIVQKPMKQGHSVVTRKPPGKDTRALTEIMERRVGGGEF